MSSRRMRPWRALLRGDAKARSLDTVAAIVNDLRQPARDASLARGSAGLAVLFDYLSRRKPAGGETAVRCLDAAVNQVASRRMAPSFFSGFTGVAWAAEHLKRTVTAAPEDGNRDIDRVLNDYLTGSPRLAEYDLVDGLVGFGVYALERLPRRSAVVCLSRVVEQLNRTARRTPDGATWMTRAEKIDRASARRHHPACYYDLGLAHGVTGVIALLGATCAAGVAVKKARPLLASAVSWLMAQKQPPGTGSTFSNLVAPGEVGSPSRSAWCYGDPGIAAALLVAARGAGEPAWEREALALARRAATRPPEEAGVRDAGLCHGAAGLAHIFNRLFQATGDRSLGRASRFWFERAMEMRQPGRGIGGFQALTFPCGRPVWRDEPGLLTGAAGIALALLAACSNQEPEWDRFLLLSFRSQRSQALPT